MVLLKPSCEEVGTWDTFYVRNLLTIGIFIATSINPICPLTQLKCYIFVMKIGMRNNVVLVIK